MLQESLSLANFDVDAFASLKCLIVCLPGVWHAVDVWFVARYAVDSIVVAIVAPSVQRDAACCYMLELQGSGDCFWYRSSYLGCAACTLHHEMLAQLAVPLCMRVWEGGRMLRA